MFRNYLMFSSFRKRFASFIFLCAAPFASHSLISAIILPSLSGLLIESAVGSYTKSIPQSKSCILSPTTFTNIAGSPGNISRGIITYSLANLPSSSGTPALMALFSSNTGVSHSAGSHPCFLNRAISSLISCSFMFLVCLFRLQSKSISIHSHLVEVYLRG